MMQLYWVALKSIWAKEIHRFMRIWSRLWFLPSLL